MHAEPSELTRLGTWFLTHIAKYNAESLAIRATMPLLAVGKTLCLCLIAFKRTMRNKTNSITAVVIHPVALMACAEIAHAPFGV